MHLEPDPAALSVSCADADRAAEAVAELSRAGVGIADFSLGQPSLDEVFLALTGHPAEEDDERHRGGAGGMSDHPDRTARAARPTRTRRCARPSPRRPRPPRASALSAALTFGWRGMLKVKHVPEQLLDVTITPVMFLLMFTYLFGGAIAGSTGDYLDYILPGILVMSVLFTTVYSGVALNTDLTKGVVDRFRSLPIWRPAPLVGAAARRQRALPGRRHRDHRARRDPRLPPGRRRAAACSPRWRW